MTAPPPRAVLDTSVLVPLWSRLLLADLAGRAGRYTPIWCEWIIAETWRVLTVQHLRRLPHISTADERRLSGLANAMLLALLPVMEFVSVVPPFAPAWPAARDSDDAPIWMAAVRAKAQFVISHNLRDFPPRNAAGLCAHGGIEFITVANFVEGVLGLDPDLLVVGSVPPGGRLTHQRRV